jgi:hypothetical protein
MKFVGEVYVNDISPGWATLATVKGDHRVEIGADTVVLVTPNHPNIELADELAEWEGEVVTLGDARGPFGLQHAIHEAANVMRQI